MNRRTMLKSGGAGVALGAVLGGSLGCGEAQGLSAKKASLAFKNDLTYLTNYITGNDQLIHLFLVKRLADLTK